MAYMQHDCFGFASSPALPVGQRTATRALSSLERQVIALASREPLSSLSTGKRPIARALFGVEPARALADPVLEALRRFVVLHHHGSRGAESAGKVLIELGFTRRTLDEVRARVVARRSTCAFELLGLIPIAMMIVGAVALIASYLDEVLPATAISLAICLPLVSVVHGLAAPSRRSGRGSAA